MPQLGSGTNRLRPHSARGRQSGRCRPKSKQLQPCDVGLPSGARLSGELSGTECRATWVHSYSNRRTPPTAVRLPDGHIQIQVLPSTVSEGVNDAKSTHDPPSPRGACAVSAQFGRLLAGSVGTAQARSAGGCLEEGAQGRFRQGALAPGMLRGQSHHPAKVLQSP